KLRLADRYELEEGALYLSGLQALVRIPIDQYRLDQRNGRRTQTLISGYEGSPLAGYDLEIGRQRKLLEAHGVVHRPAVNEELGANAVQGSQLASASADRTCDGVAGIWYGKAPGLDRATDALRHGNLGGADRHGGVLIMVGDDSVAKSSTVPSSSEIAIAEIGMPVLAPADPQDVLDLGLHGIALSRFCGLWTGFKLATNVVDGSASVQLAEDRIEIIEPDRTIDGTEFRHEVSANFLQPNLSQLETSLMGARLELARRYAYANHLNRIEGDPAARVGVIAAGASYLDVRQALQLIGIGPGELASSGVRVLKLGMVSPLEPRIAEEFAAGLDEIVVVEEKRPFVELAVKDLFYGRPDAPLVSGRRSPAGTPMLRPAGDLPPDVIAAALAPRIIAHVDQPAVHAWLAARQSPAAQRDGRRRLELLPITARTPYFCSGCPHNRGTQVPDGSLVGAGIGCSTLAVLMPEERFGQIIGFTQMGGEGGLWVGMEPFVRQEHLLQNIGDGTFHHSGSLAVRQAVGAGSHITFKLLYNGAVAMTGGQQAVGKMPVPRVATALLAEGVRKVIITTDDPRRYRRVRLSRGAEVRHRDQLAQVQEELAAIDGVTVLIHDQECATELRRKRKRGLVAEPTQRVLINERVCEGCGDCGAKSNCLSVQPVDTEFGRKTRIHQASCNKDFSCLDGDCPSFLTVKPGKAGKPRRAAGTPADDRSLPEPEIRVRTDEFNMRITGVGGTGVVTVAQVISTAASMAGLQVRALDQMGLAQKGGAVVSDIRLSPEPFTGANKLTPGSCDLYLGCDLLVAADAVQLAAASPERTIAVTCTSRVPTGAMVRDTAVSFPDVPATVDRIHDLTRAEHGVAVDARAETTALLGDDQSTNVFLVGAAVQAGALPVPPRFLEEALELNGVAVEANIAAFRAGRRYVAEGARAGSDSGAGVANVTGDEGVDAVIRRRVAELTAYQNAAYAQEYAGHVRAISEAERNSLGSPGRLTETYARNLFKLMAYKDEYEVARLSLDPALDQTVAAQFGDGARYYYRLHPPVLRSLGMSRKVTLGPWFRPAFRALYASRRVRGTAWDVFGRTEVRRTERALPGEYRDAVSAALPRLSAETLPALVALAELPDMVRGYEHVKLANVARFRTALAEAVTVLASGA
ncbi:MAG TPA: indolepyruvate ferredoxin oxidoreductase family protein, partial [Streptosporangiaceae bacterium]|nr:indolepyruvate ferredoxin oxidoreductase family protein [Streptosporangiaceae bacterium]